MEELFISGSMGKLYGNLQVPDKNAPLIILSHGFNGNHKGNQDYADFFAANGFASFCLDFCGGGMDSRSEGDFKKMSVLTEAQDLHAVIDYFLPRFPCVFLWGASQGGFVSSYVAAERPDDIRALVIEFPAYVLQDDARRRANPDGSFPEETADMNTVISRKYQEDAVSFDIYEVIGHYTGDVLILHGDQDALVPLRYSEKAAEVFPSSELIVMPGERHGFCGKARKEAMKRELEFFRKHV